MSLLCTCHLSKLLPRCFSGNEMVPSDSLVKVIDGLNTTKFGKFLERVVAKLPLSPGARPLDIFTFEEREKLVSVFELQSVADLAAILEWSESLFEHAAFDQLKPEQFQGKLSKFNDEFVQVISQVWSVHGGELIDRLKAKPPSSRQLSDVNFVINVDIASQAKAHVNRPTAHVQLVTEDLKGQCEKLNLDMDHGQLLQLYDKLEDIQKQLDALTG